MKRYILPAIMLLLCSHSIKAQGLAEVYSAYDINRNKTVDVEDVTLQINQILKQVKVVQTELDGDALDAVLYVFDRRLANIEKMLNLLYYPDIVGGPNNAPARKDAESAPEAAESKNESTTTETK